MKNLKKTDPKIYRAIKNEEKRQEESIELIPSEIPASKAVIEALGSVLTNKYSEGYSGRRYYGGQEFIDEIESLAIERAKKLFKVPHVNVQPYSGSPANLAVYVATCEPGNKVLGQNLPDGGHLTHGWKASMTSSFYKTLAYHVKEDGYIDLEEVKKLAKKHK
ncbi:MAG: serine hydroxymethyltransferase, partial [Candidatus Moranbacteria bacterium]|nr:serine hydroxymethyltransferase [Candidatus Moranbacteria bacterium]